MSELIEKNVNLEKVPCPWCQGQDATVQAEIRLSPVKVQTHLNLCNQCGLSYASPRPTKAYEQKFYEQEHYQRDDQTEWKENRESFFNAALDGMEKRIAGRKILDVGCGMGFFLDMARKRGWEPTGTELSEQAVEHTKNNLKLFAMKGDILNLALEKNSYAAITLWNVLDQMQNPKDQLQKCLEFMRPGGLLALRVSNLTFHLQTQKIWNGLKSKGFFKGKSEKPTVFHLSMFSPQSLHSLLKDVGFEDIEVLNSPLDTKTKALYALVGAKFAPFMIRFVFGFAEILRRISFGKWVIGPSLLVFARKP